MHTAPTVPDIRIYDYHPSPPNPRLAVRLQKPQIMQMLLYCRDLPSRHFTLHCSAFTQVPCFFFFGIASVMFAVTRPSAETWFFAWERTSGPASTRRSTRKRELLVRSPLSAKTILPSHRIFSPCLPYFYFPSSSLLRFWRFAGFTHRAIQVTREGVGGVGRRTPQQNPIRALLCWL